MRVRVHLFARYREAIGRAQVDLEIPEGGTVDAAWSAVVDRHPQLAEYRPFTLFAVGHDYVEPDYLLKPGDELCLFPPVSGGSGETTRAIPRRATAAPGRVRALGGVGGHLGAPHLE